MNHSACCFGLVSIFSIVACSSGASGGGGSGGSGAMGGGGGTSGSGATGGSANVMALDTTGRSCNQTAAAGSAAAPDLAVDALNGSVSYDSTTGDMSVQVSYSNIGQADAGPYTVGIFLYPNTNAPCSAYYVGDFSDPGLASQAVFSGTATVHLQQLDKAVPPGGYQVGYVVDVDNQVVEASESNNVKTVGVVHL
ncbi:MAG: hypothetical protein KC776_11795 [Myxococcales bacterium]|nr:hypothetical protein [Myxococcales bacterium]